MTSTPSQPSRSSCSAAAAATSAEPSCSPWSTTKPRTSPPRRCATCTAAAASARESAPPEQATASGAPRNGAASGESSNRRTAVRISLTARSGGTPRFSPPAPPLAAAGRSAVHPPQPHRGLLDLRAGGQVLGRGPHRVEPVHADRFDHLAGESSPLRVLADLGVHPEQAAQDPVQQPAALAPVGEARADGGH